MKYGFVIYYIEFNFLTNILVEMFGGSAIGSGGFGCVFKPSLKCPGEKGGKDDVVSKLIFSLDSKKEANAKIQKMKYFETS